MAEVLGIVSSIISIVGVAKTCIDVYVLVDDSKHASKDQRRLVSQLKEQRLRFVLWCDCVGISEVLHLQQLASVAVSTPELDAETIFKLTPRLQRAIICKEILSILQRIVELFQDSRDLLEKYTSQRSGSVVTSLVKSSSNYLISGLAEAISMSEGQSQEFRKQTKSGMTVFQNIAWTTIDKKKLTDLVDQLRNGNDGLQNILGMVEMAQLRRRKELLATTTPFASVVATAHTMEEYSLFLGTNPQALLEPKKQSADRLSSEDRDMRQLVEIYRRRYAIDQDLGEDTIESSIVPEAVAPGPPFFADDYHLLSSNVRLLESKDGSSQDRALAYYKSKPIIVEWKYYSANISADLLKVLKRRVSMLASQLQRSSQTSGFHTLGCAGYFDNVEMNRIGIAFEHDNSSMSPGPISLKDRILGDRFEKNVRDLTSRFSVAKALVMAVYRLHSVGWLHKSIRSDNILFFEGSELDRHSLAAPFVCGFDFSRQDSPLELTENVPTVLLSQYMNKERSLYRHPDLDVRAFVPSFGGEDEDPLGVEALAAEKQATEYRYRKAYDVYSLGIVLLEIGLWFPVKDLCRHKENVHDFRSKLHSQLLPELRYRTGKIYYEIVRRCLEGDVGQGQTSAVTQIVGGNSEISELRESRVWLAGFDKYIVSEIEKCNV